MFGWKSWAHAGRFHHDSMTEIIGDAFKWQIILLNVPLWHIWLNPVYSWSTVHNNVQLAYDLTILSSPLLVL